MDWWSDGLMDWRCSGLLVSFQLGMQHLPRSASFCIVLHRLALLLAAEVGAKARASRDPVRVHVVGVALD